MKKKHYFSRQQENVLVLELLLTKMIRVNVMLTFLQLKMKMTTQPVNVCGIIC